MRNDMNNTTTNAIRSNNNSSSNIYAIIMGSGTGNPSDETNSRVPETDSSQRTPIID